jgi:Abnormal spindle-like microcephaly-assoc'd, ASPM-SPD-2-Hydin
MFLTLLLAPGCVPCWSQVSIEGPTEVRLGGSAQYIAEVNGVPDSAVVWSVNGFVDGNSTTGSITGSGLYSPASTIWPGHSVTISVTTSSTPASSASLSVKVLNELPTFSSGSITQTTAGSSFLLNVQGTNFVSGSQLLVSGSDVTTVFVSSSNLQSTITLSVGTKAVVVGIMNPDAAQKSPVDRTLLVQSLAGTPALTISPSSVAFGDVTINTTDTQAVTLSSTGTAPVTVNSATVSGTGFLLSPATFPVTLNPGLALTLDVQYDPAITGSSAGQLKVSSNSSANSTATVGLTGTGEPHQVTLSWQAPADSPVPVAGYNSYRATSGSTTFERLNSSPDTGTTFIDSTVQAGTTYTYYVTSVSSSGVESAPSNDVSATIP